MLSKSLSHKFIYKLIAGDIDTNLLRYISKFTTVPLTTGPCFCALVHRGTVPGSASAARTVPLSTACL